MTTLYPHLLNAFLLSIMLILVLRRLAPQFRLVDAPDARKQHEGLVPLCGGLAIFSAFMITGIGFDEAIRVPWNVETGLVLLVLIGLADDRWRLSATTRLGAHLVAATILVAPAAVAPFNLGAVSSDIVWLLPPLAGGLLAVVFTTGMINAFNMIDGMDGLAGASAGAAFFWFALLSVHVGDAVLAVQALTLLAAVLGFLVFNMRHRWRSRASVFLGDAGSIMLGAMAAHFAVVLASGSHPLSFVALLWFLIVPIADTLSLIVRRLAARRSPFSGDRQHMHHLLVDAGMSHVAAASVLIAAAWFFGAVGYVGIIAGVPDTVMAAGLIVPLVLHTVIVVATGGGSGVRARRSATGGLGWTVPSIPGDER